MNAGICSRENKLFREHSGRLGCFSQGRLYNLLDVWGSRFQREEKVYLSLTRITE